MAPRLKEKPSSPAFRHALPVILNAVRHAVSHLHNLATVNTLRPATSQAHWMLWSMLHHSDATWPYYEHYLAIRMKCCRICGEKPSTLGIIITRTGPLFALKVGLLFNFFRGDILGLSGPPDFICSLYQADKVRKLHWLFFKLFFTTSSKSSW